MKNLLLDSAKPERHSRPAGSRAHFLSPRGEGSFSVRQPLARLSTGMEPSPAGGMEGDGGNDVPS